MTPSSRSDARSALQRRRRPARARRRGIVHSCEGLESRLVLSGTYAGIVFQDYNANGARDTDGSIPNASGNGSVATARDRGLAGISVSAFDPAGNLAGSAITAPDGSYSLEASGTGPYRIHFDNLPDGFSAGPQGPDSKTAVQFVPDGGASNISLGAVKPEDFSVDNPFLATQAYSFGSYTGEFANNPTIVGFPYSAGSEYSDPSRSNDPATYMNPAFTTLATHGQVGATWGLAYNRQAGMVYAAAFFKKHSDFGPAGAGAIYQIPVSYDEATGLFTATGAPTVLTTLASASQNAHDPSNFDTDNWNTGWAAVGTTSLGGIDVSADGTTLYAMNLADRSLYAIPLADPGGAAAYPVPIPADATGPDGSDIRPFAVTVRDGLVYIGMVNSAQSTQDAVDLHSYVYSFDPSTGQYAQVLEVRDMTYNRGVINAGNPPSEWHPWSPTFRTDPTTTNEFATYSQPMLTGLSFDAAGNLVLGFRSRAADQFGWRTRDNPDSPDQRYWAVSAGDILQATPNGDDTFTIEQDIYDAPPGEKSAFYVDQNWQGYHDNIANGGLAQVPGFLDVAATVMDPANTFPPNTGGVRWFNNITGRADKAYTVYNSTTRPDPVGHFGKANGMGDLIYMSTQAPVEVGHRLWLDSDRDGIQDPGEPPLAGVTVELRDADGNLLASVVTDDQGNYTFSSDPRRADTPSAAYGLPLLPGTDYTLVVPPDQPALDRLQRTAADAGGDDAIDSDGQPNGTNGWSLPITTAGPGFSENSYDFGFIQLLSLGDLIWEDRNNNGIVDPGEPGIADVPIQLLDADGNVVATTTTDADGKYLFGNLIPGDYRIRLTPPPGYRSSTGANGSASGPYEGAPDPNNDVDNDDNGTIAGEFIESAPITLAVDTEPTNDGDDDPNSNLTVDFGLFQPLSLGDLVWEDRNNNGIVDAGEPGIANVPVQLLDSAGNVVATTTTDANGNYLFDNLIPGDYRVRLTPPPGYRSSTGTNGAPSGPYEPAPDPNNDVDNDDNGSAVGESIESAPITLTVGGEPTNDGDDNPNSNLTADFGLFQPLSLGNLVWEDRNNNGLVDADEPGIVGVPVQLLDSAGNVVATTTTDANGNYLFTGLIPGDYRVRLTPPSGYRSSTGANGSASGPYEGAPDPDNDVDNDDNGTAAGEFIESGPITLAVGEEPVNDGDDNPNSNLTVDFGLFQPLSLGNLVWEDRNNNGVVDPGEPGIAGVPIQLLDADGNVVATTTTDADGKYLFDNLIPGDYRVRLMPPPGYSSSTGTNGSPDGPYEPASDPDNNVDNDDNGTTAGAFIESAPITLAVGAEPVDDGDTNPDSNLTVDFGLFQPLSLGDLVWEDRNNNGVVDPDEPGITGVPVQLLDANGDVVATTTTDADGKYLFTGLIPGDYRVRLTPPSGYRSSTGANGAETGPYEPAPDPDNDVDNDDNGTADGEFIESAPITLAVGAEPTNDGDDDPNSNLTVDFGLFQPLSLGNLVWEDRNNNGVVDPGEPGIANVPVQLLDSAGNVVATTTTDADGKYLFGNLIPGDYRVRLTPPSGYRSSTGANGSASGPYEGAPDPDSDVDNDDNGTIAGEFIESAPITLAVGAEPTNDGDDDPNSNLTVDFGLFRPASVGDLVFIDADADGKQGPGEAGVPGVAVRLYDSAGNVVATTTTGPDGKYLFDDLIPGTYSVGFDPATLPPNHAFTVPGQPGTADPSDSDADPASGRTAPFALAPGQADMTRDAGLVPLSRLDGSVYVDLDNDGARDPGEPPIPGTTMHLTGVDDLGNPVDLAVVTGPDGSYSFPGLRPGTYSVAQVQPPGYLDGRITPGTAGGVPGENSIGRVVLGPGVIARGYDFGELPSDTCLGGRVYYDLNHNGRLDEGIDFGMAGVSVTLTGVDDRGQAVSLVAITDAEGNYHFQGLRPGTYTLTEAPPRFWRHYATTAGSLGGSSAGSRISGIVVAPGQCGAGYDFGELQPHGPQGKLREAAILVGNAMERLRQRRALDPDRFDAHHPEAGPIIGGGGIPWGRGSFPRAPKFIRRVPTLGSRPVRLGSSAPRVLPMAFRPPASGARHGVARERDR